MGELYNSYLVFFEGDYNAKELGTVVWKGKEYSLDPSEVFETLSELKEIIEKSNEYWDPDYEELMNEGYKCFAFTASVDNGYTEFDLEIHLIHLIVGHLHYQELSTSQGKGQSCWLQYQYDYHRLNHLMLKR